MLDEEALLSKIVWFLAATDQAGYLKQKMALHRHKSFRGWFNSVVSKRSRHVLVKRTTKQLDISSQRLGTHVKD